MAEEKKREKRSLGVDDERPPAKPMAGQLAEYESMRKKLGVPLFKPPTKAVKE